MTWADAAVVVGSLGSLVVAGWAFLNRSLYRDFEEKDQVAQVLAGPSAPFCSVRSNAIAHCTIARRNPPMSCVGVVLSCTALPTCITSFGLIRSLHMLSFLICHCDQGITGG